jgi:hypothetical protein
MYVVCINNKDYPASLELRKLYPVVPDPQAEAHGMIRVIDESGEDYLFPADMFAPVELPKAALDAFAVAS